MAIVWNVTQERLPLTRGYIEPDEQRNVDVTQPAEASFISDGALVVVDGSADPPAPTTKTVPVVTTVAFTDPSRQVNLDIPSEATDAELAAAIAAIGGRFRGAYASLSTGAAVKANDVVTNPSGALVSRIADGTISGSYNPANWTALSAGGSGLPAGGTTGQVLKKNSGTDGDAGWGAAAAAGLTPTGVKTANYTAVAGDLVRVDTTSGPVTVTLPAAAAGAAPIGVKHVTQGGTNAVTVAAAGSDVFNKTGGSTTLSLGLLNQGVVLAAVAGVWVVQADDLALSQLDSRYGPGRTISLLPSGDTTGATDQAAIAAAIATLLARTPAGGELRLAAGDWYWNSQQIDIYTVPARLKITGEGQSTKIHSTATGTAGTTKALFYVYGGGDVAPYPSSGAPGASGINWLEISDMELVGNTHACGIALRGVYQGRIANIIGHGFQATGEFGSLLWMDKSIDLVVENPVCWDCTYGAYLRGWSNVNNFIGGWLLLCSAAGVHLEASGAYCEGNNFFGTVFQQCSAGAEVGAGVRGTRFYGCWMEANGRGAIINGISTLVDNPTLASNGYAFQIDSSATDTTIRGGEGAMGMVIASGSTGTVIDAPPSTFDYSQVTDGTSGQGVSIRKGKRAVSTNGNSGAAATIPSPLLADETVLQLTANCTLSFPPPVAGQVFDLLLVQVSAGSYTVTWPASVSWPGGTAPTLATTAGNGDRIRFSSDDGVKWYGSVVGANYATSYSTFSPASLSPQVWFKADAITGVTTDGTAVSSWTDQSGNARHALQATGANQPLFKTNIQNGKPAVLFDGVNDYLRPNDWSPWISQPVTIVIVGSMNAGATYFYDGHGASNRIAFGDSLVTGGNLEVYGGSAAVGAAQSKPTGMHMWTCVFNGTSSSIRKDSTAFASGATNIGTHQWSCITLGASQNGATGFLSGYICEVVGIPRLLTGTERTNLEAYLQAKWATP